MVNRFEELRYKDKLSATPFISMSQLAKELDISKATVSKLEHDEDYDARISIIKKYKERFPEVSYDYLLGATGTKHKQYSRIEEELPFSNEFYDALGKLLEKDDPMYGDRFSYGVEYMLEAMLRNPEQLAEFLRQIYEALRNVYHIKNAERIQQYFSSKEYAINEQYFYISRTVIRYFENTVAPLLDGIFERLLQEYIRDFDFFRPFPFSDDPPFDDSVQSDFDDEELPFK